MRSRRITVHAAFYDVVADGEESDDLTIRKSKDGQLARFVLDGTSGFCDLDKDAVLELAEQLATLVEGMSS